MVEENKVKKELDNWIVKAGEFIEIKYSGYANGELFDSNIEEDAKKLDPNFKVRAYIVCVGKGMVVSGLDKALENKEIGKEYEVEVGFKDGFGERRRELVKTIPLKAFSEKKVNPSPGMILTLDDMMVKIIAVSGARVVTDFNSPLAGKDLKYKFTIVRKVSDDKEKVRTLFEMFWKFVPEFDVSGEKIVVKGPRGLEIFVKEFSDKFKEFIGKGMIFEEKKETLDKKIERDKKKNVEDKDSLEGDLNK